MRLQEIIVAATLTLALQMLTLPPDAERMFAVAKGESAAAPHAVVCVMRNRVLAGWNEQKVLNHFYAPPRSFNARERLRMMLAYRLGVGCNGWEYFSFSYDDVRKVCPNPDSFLYEAGGNHFYDINALRKRKCK